MPLRDRRGFDGLREKADGDYVSHADAEAEAEISKLRAECDRLKALAGKPPVLEQYVNECSGANFIT